jgi:hypothetical protein
MPREAMPRRVHASREPMLRGRMRLPEIAYRFEAWRSVKVFLLTLPIYVFVCLTRPLDVLHAELASQARADMVEAGLFNETTKPDWGVIYRSGWMFLEARRNTPHECKMQWFRVDLSHHKACLDTDGLLGSKRYLSGQRAESFLRHLHDLHVPFRIEQNGQWLSLPAFLALPPGDVAHVRVYPLRGGAPKHDAKGRRPKTLQAGWGRYTEAQLRSFSLAELRVLASSHGVSRAPKEELVRGLLRAQMLELNSASSSARGSAEVCLGGAGQEDKNKNRRDAYALRKDELNKGRRDKQKQQKAEQSTVQQSTVQLIWRHL